MASSSVVIFLFWLKSKLYTKGEAGGEGGTKTTNTFSCTQQWYSSRAPILPYVSLAVRSMYSICTLVCIRVRLNVHNCTSVPPQEGWVRLVRPWLTWARPHLEHNHTTHTDCSDTHRGVGDIGGVGVTVRVFNSLWQRRSGPDISKATFSPHRSRSAASHTHASPSPCSSHFSPLVAAACEWEAGDENLHLQKTPGQT